MKVGYVDCLHTRIFFENKDRSTRKKDKKVGVRCYSWFTTLFCKLFRVKFEKVTVRKKTYYVNKKSFDKLVDTWNKRDQFTSTEKSCQKILDGYIAFRKQCKDGAKPTGKKASKPATEKENPVQKSNKKATSETQGDQPVKKKTGGDTSVEDSARESGDEEDGDASSHSTPPPVAKDDDALLQTPKRDTKGGKLPVSPGLQKCFDKCSSEEMDFVVSFLNDFLLGKDSGQKLDWQKLKKQPEFTLVSSRIPASESATSKELANELKTLIEKRLGLQDKNLLTLHDEKGEYSLTIACSKFETIGLDKCLVEKYKYDTQKAWETLEEGVKHSRVAVEAGDRETCQIDYSKIIGLVEKFEKDVEGSLQEFKTITSLLKKEKVFKKIHINKMRGIVYANYQVELSRVSSPQNGSPQTVRTLSYTLPRLAERLWGTFGLGVSDPGNKKKTLSSFVAACKTKYGAPPVSGKEPIIMIQVAK